MLANLVPHQLQGKTCLVPVDGTAMHQQARWLVDRHQILILVDHLAGPIVHLCHSQENSTVNSGRI